MTTVNGGVHVGWGGVGKWADDCYVNGGDGEILLSSVFLKPLTEGAVTTEAGSLFQFFTTIIENADPLLRRWLAAWIAL